MLWFFERSSSPHASSMVFRLLRQALPVYSKGLTLTAVIFMLACYTTPARCATGTRRALLIGVEECAGAPSLPGATKDASLLAERLWTEFGFSRDHTTILNRQGNTGRNDILVALEALVQATCPGDVVFISFSGHGAIQRNPSRTEESGFDEILVAKEGRPKGDIIDDTIGMYLDRLLEKQANVTFVVDSCSAGGSDRAAWANRRYPIIDPDVDINAKSAKKDNRRWIEWPNGTRPPRRPGARLDCFFACEAEQSSEDLYRSGAFTWALLATAHRGLTCEEVMTGVQSAMTHQLDIPPDTQHPYGVFDGPTRPFLSTDGPSVPSFRLSDVRGAGGNAGTLSGGEIQGIYPGTELAVYADNTTLDEADGVHPPTDRRLIGIVRVDQHVGAVSSEVKRIIGSKPLPQNGVALVTKWNYGDQRIQVLVPRGSLSSPSIAPVCAELAKSGLIALKECDIARSNVDDSIKLANVDFTATNALLLLPDQNQNLVEIRSLQSDGPLQYAECSANQAGKVVKNAVFATTAVVAVRTALEAFARAENMKRLSNRSWAIQNSGYIWTAPAAGVSVKIFAYSNPADQKDCPPDMRPVQPNTDGRIVLYENEGVCLEIANHPPSGYISATQLQHTLSYAVVAVTEDGEVTCLEPKPKDGTAQRLGPTKPTEEPKRVHTANTNMVTPQQEYLKIIVARYRPEGLNIGTLEQKCIEMRSGDVSGPPCNPLEWLLRHSLKGFRGDEPSPSVGVEDWFAFTIPYIVKAAAMAPQQ